MSIDLEIVKQDIRNLANDLKNRNITLNTNSPTLPPLLPLNFPLLQNHIPVNTNTTGNSRYKDLVKHHDREFIINAYNSILRHDPDPQSENLYLSQLRAGMSKVEILVRLRYSSEGKQLAINLKGIFFPAVIAFIEKIPVLSYFSKWFFAFALLPKRLENLELRQSLLEDHIKKSNSLIQTKINASMLHINKLNHRKSQ